ncbi:hypothetical protein BH10PSE14_BH10PSE14_37690 [soil metagenome]
MSLKFQLFAIDDNVTTMIDICNAADRKDLPDVREAGSEEDGLRLVHEFRKEKLPPVFIVDLKLKDEQSGFRILEAIRRKPVLRYAPVIVLTSSNDQETINKSYELGASSYIIKEDDPDDFARVLDNLISFLTDAAYYDDDIDDAAGEQSIELK